MFKTVVNLTEQAVISEIENVLDTYPYHPHQQAFAIPDLRSELIAYVLSHVPCVYGAISVDQKPQFNHNPRNYLEQQVQLQNIIHQGICFLLQEKSDWITQHLPEQMQCGFEPSHWFG